MEPLDDRFAFNDPSVREVRRHETGPAGTARTSQPLGNPDRVHPLPVGSQSCTCTHIPRNGAQVIPHHRLRSTASFPSVPSLSFVSRRREYQDGTDHADRKYQDGQYESEYEATPHRLLAPTTGEHDASQLRARFAFAALLE
jgi:hypothetical protein